MTNLMNPLNIKDPTISIRSFLLPREIAASQSVSKTFQATGEGAFVSLMRTARTLDFLPECLDFSAHTLHKPTSGRAILDGMANVSSLVISEVSKEPSTDERLQSILSSKNAGRLRQITVSGPAVSQYVTTECMQVMVSQCPHLIRLDLHGDCLSDEDSSYLEILKSLQQISFDGSCEITDNTLLRLGNISSLTEVSLNSCPKISHFCIGHLLKAPRLTRLAVGNRAYFDPNGKDWQKRARIACAIADNGGRLVHLDMRFNTYSNHELLMIARLCQNLRHIKLDGFHKGILTESSELAEQMRALNPQLQIVGLEQSQALVAMPPPVPLSKT